MTRKHIIIPLTALVGGLAALFLRIWNLRAGFEDGSGLPIPGHPSFPATVAALALTLAALIPLALKLSRNAPRFPFRAGNRSVAALSVAGSFLLALAGFADLFEALSGKKLASLLGGDALNEYEFVGLIGGDNVGITPAAQGFAGLLTALSAWALFECVRACLRGHPRPRAAVLLPAVALAFRLVVIYRVDSVNPVLESYALVLLALALQTLGFYAFSAFPFDCGDMRKFAAASGAALCAALCALTDESEYLSIPLTLAGSALALTGFLLLAMDAPPVLAVAPDSK